MQLIERELYRCIVEERIREVRDLISISKKKKKNRS